MQSPARRRGRTAASLSLAALLVPLTVGLSVACGGDGTADEREPARGTEDAAPDYESMSFPYDLEPRQKRAVGALLDAHHGWRLATAADNRNEHLGRVKRDHPDYQPYFAEGDLTDDGREDFAVALTNDRGTFRIVWFRHAGSSYAPAQPLATVPWLGRGGLFMENGELLAREFFTERAERYRWSPDSRRLEERAVTGAPRS